MTKKDKSEIQDDGERMIPEFHKGTLLYAEHITRYMAAESIVRGKVVLDIASGSGYGTKLLSKHAKKVFGVDVDKDAIEYAKKHFAGDNIEYKVGDGEKIPLKDASVDVVITFETIEHVENYKQFIKEVKRVLKPDGIAIVSTPNVLEFEKGNHFHLHEFEYKELVDLLKKDFKNIDNYSQATWAYVAIGPESLIRNEGLYNIPTHNFKPLEPEKDLYFYLLCSNRDVTEKIEPIAALGGHYSARELTDIFALNSKNIEDYQKVLKNAENSYKQLEVEYKRLSDRTDAILNGKTYQIADKLLRAKRKIIK